MLEKSIELLSPAGDLTRLKAAVDYGADAVYLAGEEFGMRTAATNFGEEDLKAGIEYAHSHGVKVHVTCNTIPHNAEMPRLPAFLESLNDLGADAVIASDLGTMTLIKKYAPNCDLHISVQSAPSYPVSEAPETDKFWMAVQYLYSSPLQYVKLLRHYRIL